MVEFYSEHDLHGGQDDHGSIELGTVGWADGTSTEDTGTTEDGHTFVRVTLFVGRDRSEDDQTPGVASGYQIPARISAPIQHVPKKGAVVMVMRAARTELWCITADLSPNATQFKGGKRTIQNFGDDTDLIIRAKSVTLMDATGRFLTLSEQVGFMVQDKQACGMTLLNGAWCTYIAGSDGNMATYTRLTSSLWMASNRSSTGSSATLALKEGKVTATGKTFAAATGNVALGANASPATAVQVGPSPYAPPSLTIFGQL